jgi:hypothetical protein
MKAGCHSKVNHTLWLKNELPEEEPCHRNKQDNASSKYYQHEMSVYKENLTLSRVPNCTRQTNTHTHTRQQMKL